MRWLIWLFNNLSALSARRSTIRSSEQKGLTSHSRRFSSRRSSNSAMLLMHEKMYVEGSCNIPCNGYLHASSHRSCQNNSNTTFKRLPIFTSRINISPKDILLFVHKYITKLKLLLKSRVSWLGSLQIREAITKMCNVSTITSQNLFWFFFNSQKLPMSWYKRFYALDIEWNH